MIHCNFYIYIYIRWTYAVVDSSEALRVEEALQRQCQTLSTLCPLTNAQDYCASRFFWFYCSSDRWLWPGAESLTNEQKWPSAVVLQWTESRFSTYTKMTQIEVRIARPRSSCDGIRSGSLGGPANRWRTSPFARSGHFPCTQSLPQRKVESSFGGFCCMAPFTAIVGGKEALRFIGFKKTWTLGRSPVSPPMVLNFKIRTWTPSELWLDTRCQVRERSYARNRSEIKLLLRHLLKPLQHLCQDLTPHRAHMLDLDRTSGRAGKGPC